MTQPFPPRLHPLRSPRFSSPPLPSPFTGVRGYNPWKKNFGITDARGRVLEHFGHKNQHLYEPGFFLLEVVSFEFQVNVHATL